MTARVAWAHDLLVRQCGVALAPSLVRVVAWATKEGGWWGNDAAFNPLNTTQPMAGSRPINNVGVQAFTDYESGMAATITTLNNGHYPRIVAALAHGDPYTDDPCLDEMNVWGTGDIAAYLAPAEAEIEASGGDLPLTADDLSQITTIVAQQIANACANGPTPGVIAKLMDDFYNNQYAPQLNQALHDIEAIKGKVGA